MKDWNKKITGDVTKGDLISYSIGIAIGVIIGFMWGLVLGVFS